MLSKRVLLAIEELEQWKKREEEFKHAIAVATPGKRAQLKKDLEKVREQTEYYESLIKEMKKELHPLRIADVIK